MTLVPQHSPSHTQSRLRRKTALKLLAGLCLIVLAVSALASQSSKRKNPAAKPAKEVPKDAPMPFRVGETLNYRVSWSAFSNAASVQLTVPERRDLFGWPTWHFRAYAHTQSSVRSLFTIDDQFDSYTDSSTLECHKLEFYLDELGRKQNQIMNLVPQGGTGRGGAPVVIVQPGTRDPLGALYNLRGVDWQHTSEFSAPLYDGRNLFDMHAKLEAAAEPLSLSSGKFTAARISIHLFQFGKQDASSFIIWLANDPAHTPVAMQASLPFGNIRAELQPPSK
jgi:hypothetical protein